MDNLIVSSCCCFNLRQGCKIIAVVTILMTVFDILWSIDELGFEILPKFEDDNELTRYPKWLIYFNLILTVPSILSCGFLLIGISTNRAKFLIPFIVLQTILLPYDITFELINPDNYGIISLFLFLMILFVFLVVYFIICVYSLYEIMRRERT
ncbi:unnamed protein product [Chironomus riparius]|uniref:DUF7027 domain-containing protein n=1 Tax=Chironomus riparius TaxID=315576 RepID=A0A9N9S4F7_9DIPT|nr:unnamed protein product [Chironomus riparius]